MLLGRVINAKRRRIVLVQLANRLKETGHEEFANINMERLAQATDVRKCGDKDHRMEFRHLLRATHELCMAEQQANAPKIVQKDSEHHRSDSYKPKWAETNDTMPEYHRTGEGGGFLAFVWLSNRTIHRIMDIAAYLNCYYIGVWVLTMSLGKEHAGSNLIYASFRDGLSRLVVYGAIIGHHLNCTLLNS